MWFVSFTSMQVISPEGKSIEEKCRGDFVKVMDGDCNHFKTQTRYCGKEEPAPFISNGNKLCVKFFSDESDTAQGFSASYEAVDRPGSPEGAYNKKGQQMKALVIVIPHSKRNEKSQCMIYTKCLKSYTCIFYQMLRRKWHLHLLLFINAKYAFSFVYRRSITRRHVHLRRGALICENKLSITIFA